MPPSDQLLTVAVVTDEASLRSRLRELVKLAGHRVAGAEPSASEFPSTRPCDVVVVAGDVEQALPRARRLWPDAALLAVLSEPGSRTVSAALRGGAAGVVDERELPSRLAATLSAIACGQLCIPREFESQAERPHLSMREKQVLGMVVLGFANLEIAHRLFVTESTVKSHLNSAFRKLGVRSRVQATNLILDPTSGLGTGILTIPTTDPDRAGESST